MQKNSFLKKIITNKIPEINQLEYLSNYLNSNSFFKYTGTYILDYTADYKVFQENAHSFGELVTRLFTEYCSKLLELKWGMFRSLLNVSNTKDLKNMDLKMSCDLILNNSLHIKNIEPFFPMTKSEFSTLDDYSILKMLTQDKYDYNLKLIAEYDFLQKTNMNHIKSRGIVNKQNRRVEHTFRIKSDDDFKQSIGKFVNLLKLGL